MELLYFDHAATTPVHPEVVEAMLPFWTERFGNASSTHQAGREARAGLNQARDLIAGMIGCSHAELMFTAGGTESDNTALFGVAEAYSDRGKHIITTQIEHHAVLHACERLERMGYEVTYLPVDARGQIRLSELEEAIRPDTILISIMYGNNEVGTLQPIEAIGQLARSRGILFHSDAVQALGHVELDLTKLPVDLMSFSAHKLNGPKGVGALYIGKHVRMSPLLYGGTQERKRRAGTENTAGAAGFAKALQIFTQHEYESQQNLETLRQGFIQELTARIGEDAFVINGHEKERLPHILNISFPGISTETMLMNLDLAGIAAASGSACTSGSLEVSHVLKAMKLPDEVTRSAIRFSFGRSNHLEQIVYVARHIETIVGRLRSTV
jgi:cysteine desulfurase